MERRLAGIRPVEIRDPALNALVARIDPEHMPFEAVLVRPLAPLAELPAHEKKLLPRMGPHAAKEEPQVGELLLSVARHAANERALAVHDLVVRERQHEI